MKRRRRRREEVVVDCSFGEQEGTLQHVEAMVFRVGTMS